LAEQGRSEFLSARDVGGDALGVAGGEAALVGVSCFRERHSLSSFARRLSPYDPLKFAMLGVYAHFHFNSSATSSG
jgi:hypothetical protein